MLNAISGNGQFGLSQSINKNFSNMNKSAQRIASGKMLPTDNAAGIAIINQMTAEINGMQKGMQNGQDGMNMLNVAGGAMSSIGGDLQRMRELAVQASNGTLNDDNRAAIQAEVSQLQGNIDQVAGGTDFNGTKLLDGSAGSVNIQLDSNAPIDVGSALPDATAAGLGVDSIDMSTQAGAQSAIDDIDAALASLGESQANLGAQSNRLEGAVNELSVRSENTSSARSRLQDVDIASEMMKMKMSSIALEAGISTQSKLLNFSQTALSLITG